jgi:uncharacterized protein (TIGR01244 family)
MANGRYLSKSLWIPILGVLGFVIAAALPAASGGIEKFYRVNDQVATGAQPTPTQIASLAQEGFRSIVNLREPSEFDANAEEAAAKELGLRYISIPVKTAEPRVEQLQEFLRATNDPGNYPVFLHCGSGNRAGAFWMVRRVVVDRWTVEDAEKEAVQIGMKSPNLREFALAYIQRHSGAVRQ